MKLYFFLLAALLIGFIIGKLDKPDYMRKFGWRLLTVFAFLIGIVIFIPVWLFTGIDIGESWTDFFQDKLSN